jgi:hypothetical protein
MQAWQMAAFVAAVVFPALGIINAYLLNQVRVELAAVRIQMLEARASDGREVRAWVESEFTRKDAAKVTSEALSARVGVFESRRRHNDAAHAS